MDDQGEVVIVPLPQNPSKTRNGALRGLLDALVAEFAETIAWEIKAEPVGEH